MEPYIINQTGDQLQTILNKAIVNADLQTTEDGNQAIRLTASDGTSISITLPEAPNIEYLLRNIYYLQEGIGCAAFDYAMSLGGVTIQSEEVTRQDSDSIILDTSANRFVLERGGKFYTKFASGGGNLQGSDIYASSRHTFINHQDTSYWYRKEDGTLAQGSSTFVIANWLKTLQSECDSTQKIAEDANAAATEAKATAGTAQTDAVDAKNAATTAFNNSKSAVLNAAAANGKAEEAKATAETAKATAENAQNKLNNYADTFPQNPVASSESNGLMSAEDKSKLDSVDEVIDIPWNDDVNGQDGYVNNFTERGEYHIHGERLYANDGLPILNAASGHTIDGLMTVLDSSLPNGNKYDVCVTQILRLNNRVGGDGHIFIRTGIAATKAELQRSTAGGWSPWEKLMGVFEKNAVSNATELDKYTSSGMYDGMFVFSPESQTRVSGLKIESGSTFLMIAVNGYAVAQTGVVPQVTQLLYVMPSGLDGSSGVRNAKVYTRTGIYVATTKTYTWGDFDGLAQASDISKLSGYIQENSDLIQENQTAIAANTTKISSVESTANDAKSAAETAQTAATSAQETANSAQETATAAQEKNDAQDTRLDNIEARIDPDIAGRVWNEDNGTPKAESYYGSVKALRDLPKRLGLGRYIVKDDRTRRKLDPNDSTKYLDDGSTANLDGRDGQCMWCWEGFYANIWHEGSRLIKAVTFDGPVGNDISIWIPAGGISWLGAGVMDRTEMKLCSVISDDERYRGGGGTALDASKFSKAPADTTPQITMLGMPATYISTTDFGTYARKRGEGWEANWFVARFVVEFLFEVITGTENSQEAFNANKDANGLYQGGFGAGVVDVPDWWSYNGSNPVIPTSVGLEAGDGVCLVNYNLPDANGGTYKTFNVPVFFGLVGAGYGHLWQFVRGIIMDAGEEKSKVYVTPSMYADYYTNTVEDKIMVAECPRVSGLITRKSYRGLCCMPTEIGGSNTVRYSDYFSTSAETSNGLRVRAAGGSSNIGMSAGASCTYSDVTDTIPRPYGSAPLCYFTEDPKIPLSQSIANK